MYEYIELNVNKPRNVSINIFSQAGKAKPLLRAKRCSSCKLSLDVPYAFYFSISLSYEGSVLSSVM